MRVEKIFRNAVEEAQGVLRGERVRITDSDLKRSSARYSYEEKALRRKATARALVEAYHWGGDVSQALAGLVMDHSNMSRLVDGFAAQFQEVMVQAEKIRKGLKDREQILNQKPDMVRWMADLNGAQSDIKEMRTVTGQEIRRFDDEFEEHRKADLRMLGIGVLALDDTAAAECLGPLAHWHLRNERGYRAREALKKAGFEDPLLLLEKLDTLSGREKKIVNRHLASSGADRLLAEIGETYIKEGSGQRPHTEAGYGTEILLWRDEAQKVRSGRCWGDQKKRGK